MTRGLACVVWMKGGKVVTSPGRKDDNPPRQIGEAV